LFSNLAFVISVARVIRAATVTMQSLFLMLFVIIAEHCHTGKRAAASRAFERGIDLFIEPIND